MTSGTHRIEHGAPERAHLDLPLDTIQGALKMLDEEPVAGSARASCIDATSCIDPTDLFDVRTIVREVRFGLEEVLQLLTDALPVQLR